MTHLPYVVATYMLGAGLPVALGIMAAVRLRNARRRLQAVDPRFLEAKGGAA